MKSFKILISIMLVVTLVFNMSLSNLAEDTDNGIFLIGGSEITFSEATENETLSNDEEFEETLETTKVKKFIEETSEGLDINDYERELLRRINEIGDEGTSFENEEPENDETTKANILESLVADIVLEKVDSSSETTVEEETTTNIAESENIATTSEAENAVPNSDTEENEFDVVATISELKDIKEVNLLGSSIFGSGNHTSTASPSVVINSTYDRYEIYTGENAGTVRIFDDNGVYYNNNTVVKVIRDMMDTHNNSPILLKLSSDVQFFEFDNANDNYVLLPDGFVEDLVARESGNGYLNPQGISLLDHIKVDLTFNSTDLGMYDLFEYGVLYYLSCYEGVLGEYYYYDPNTTDINRAASFYVNNRIMNRTYNIVSEYYYKSPSGEQLSFKPTWLINNDNLTGANREVYAKQWVNFPYFLIKAGEKYWNLRDAIEQSTYLSEYAEGYYEQYLTEQPYGNVAERLTVLDDIYKTEADLINDNTSTMTVHPYVKSDLIQMSGNYRPDTINEENKLRAGGVLPYDTYAVINLNVTDHRAKSVQVYLNGEKLISNNNHGLYSLTNGKCQLRIDGSKLLTDENSRNVISFILLSEEGNYLLDAQNRVINSYISLVRSSTINKTSHLISFNTNGGSTVTSVSVEEGNKLSLPSNPSKSNKNFLGWYNDTEFQDKFDPNEYIIAPKTLYALWGDIVYVPRSSGVVVPGGGGSGGGGGGGGGGGRGGGTLPAGGVATPITGMGSLPLNAISGNFIQMGASKVFQDENGNIYRDKWAYIDTSDEEGKSSAWYRFDQLGNPIKGFYSENSKVYYFDEGILNSKDAGKMATGWKILYSNDGCFYWYYFNEDGINESKGALLTSGTSKDGWTVDANGRWTVNGIPQKVDLSKYK